MATYDDLVADLKNYAEDESLEFTSAIPTMIRMAEMRIYRDVNISAFDNTATGQIILGGTEIPRPVDLIQPLHLRIIADGAVEILEIKELEYLFVYAPDDNDRGQPVYYAINGATTYRIAPAADKAYNYILSYRRRLPPLGTTNQSNFLTTDAYDLLFAACMAEAGHFILDNRQQSIIALWEKKYQDKVAAITLVYKRSERDDFRVPTKSVSND